jgi:hypothetical protein
MIRKYLAGARFDENHHSTAVVAVRVLGINTDDYWSLGMRALLGSDAK